MDLRNQMYLNKWETFVFGAALFSLDKQLLLHI